MANVKKITAHTDTGSTVYCIVQREADGYLLNDADGAFASTPADPYVSLTEHSTIKGRYDLSESRTAWNDGKYIVTVYSQAGGSPTPASDTVVGEGEMWIISDSEVAVDDYANFKANVSALTVDLNADQSGVTIGTVNTNTDMRGTDGANTVAPDNASITAIKAKTDNLPDGVKKNTALANFTFQMLDSTDGKTGKTGLTITAERSIDGGAFAACANSAVEVGSGVYSINLAASDLNGDSITLKFTATGAIDRIITILTQT